MKSSSKSKLLELLHCVESKEEELNVIDRGKPVVKISRYHDSLSTEELFGQMRGKVKYSEDLTTLTLKEWG